MPFKNTLQGSDVDKFFKAIENDTYKVLIAMFTEVGRACVSAMESDRGYMNRTHNLSDSRGFAVVKERAIVYSSDFKSTEGGQAGRNLAQERASKMDGIGLVVVAGMDYAEELEARGQQVYSSGYLTAENLIPKMLIQLGLK